MPFPLIPLPACQSSFVGLDLRTGMKILCLVVILISIFPTLLGAICPNNSDPSRFSSILTLLAGAGVFLLLWVPGVPGIVHFLINILWFCVTLFTLLSFAVHLIYDIRNSEEKSVCRASAALATVAWAYICVVMAQGMTVYWSFYVEHS